MIRNVAALPKALQAKEMEVIARSGIAHAPTIGAQYEGLTSTLLGRIIPAELNLQVVTGSDTTCSTSTSSFGPFPAAAANSTLIGLPLGTFKLSVTGTANGHPVSGTITLPPETGAALPAQTVTLS